MAGFNLIDNTTRVLQKSLALREQRQQVIAGNIANAQTPGYAARTLKFEERLQAALKQPQQKSQQFDPRHIPLGANRIEQVQAEVESHPERSGFGDGNSVKVEDEMIALSENQILYEAAVKLTRKKLQLLKYAANDGR